MAVLCVKWLSGSAWGTLKGSDYLDAGLQAGSGQRLSRRNGPSQLNHSLSNAGSERLKSVCVMKWRPFKTRYDKGPQLLWNWVRKDARASSEPWKSDIQQIQPKAPNDNSRLETESIIIITYPPSRRTSREGPWMGRTGGNLSCFCHGSVFIPGLRECVGVVPVKSLMTGGGGGKKERERGRDAVMCREAGRRKACTHAYRLCLGSVRNSK